MFRRTALYLAFCIETYGTGGFLPFVWFATSNHRNAAGSTILNTAGNRRCRANAGYSSVWFAGRYPDARIYALEPDPEDFGYWPGQYQILKHCARTFENIVISCLLQLRSGISAQRCESQIRTLLPGRVEWQRWPRIVRLTSLRLALG